MAKSHDEADCDQLADKEGQLAHACGPESEHFLPLAELKEINRVFLLQHLHHLEFFPSRLNFDA
jgi:hypothetical protein